MARPASPDAIKADFLDWLSGDGQRDVAVAVADEYLHDTNADRDWIEEYLNAMKGPTHTHYANRCIRVRTTFRIAQDETVGDFGELAEKRLLMHGVHQTDLHALLTDGFGRAGRAGAKAFWGAGFHFADCSTKALNWAADEDAYTKEHRTDTDEIVPAASPRLYHVLLCAVALGRPHRSRTPRKKQLDGRWDDSRVSTAMFRPARLVCVPFLERFFAADGTPHERVQHVNLPVGGLQRDPEVPATSVQLPTGVYAEYCVYRPAQIRMAFLAEVVLEEQPADDGDAQ
ncbi:hypothetical protein M3Y99_00819800 [Aphelenchoides fujianensis]|nr:hypothetical protein M3Y99_00819800 [Aphelenchoides fujianensis]